MIVKMQPSRKHSSSFKRLREYLTQERNANTGELLLRGDVVMSENLLSFDTAAGEMQGRPSEILGLCQIAYVCSQSKYTRIKLQKTLVEMYICGHFQKMLYRKEQNQVQLVDRIPLPSFLLDKKAYIFMSNPNPTYHLTCLVRS